MPRLYFRDPTTQAMVPLTLGGAGGGNEVTVAAVPPTDGSDLWFDMTNNKLMYRNPSTGVYLEVPSTGTGGGSEAIDGTITAGAGLTGGGKQSTNPTLNVGAGSGITVVADSISVNRGTTDTWYAPLNGEVGVTVTNWNSAVKNNTTYQANGAANAPDTGWFYGHCVSYSATYKHQTLWPFANARWNSNQAWERELENGVWGDWNRVGLYVFSRDGSDTGMYVQHNASGSGMGIRRFFTGMIKDKASNAATANDKWRVQCYNTAGTYTWTAIEIAEDGVVSHPRGYSLLRSQMRAKTPVNPDVVATVGTVVDIVTTMLANAGISVTPAEVISLMEERDS